MRETPRNEAYKPTESSKTLQDELRYTSKDAVPVVISRFLSEKLSGLPLSSDPARALKELDALALEITEDSSDSAPIQQDELLAIVRSSEVFNAKMEGLKKQLLTNALRATKELYVDPLDISDHQEAVTEILNKEGLTSSEIDGLFAEYLGSSEQISLMRDALLEKIEPPEPRQRLQAILEQGDKTAIHDFISYWPTLKPFLQDDVRAMSTVFAASVKTRITSSLQPFLDEDVVPIRPPRTAQELEELKQTQNSNGYTDEQIDRALDLHQTFQRDHVLQEIRAYVPALEHLAALDGFSEEVSRLGDHLDTLVGKLLSKKFAFRRQVMITREKLKGL